MFPWLVYMEGYHKESFNSRNGEYMMEAKTTIKCTCGWNEESFLITNNSIITHLLPGEEILYRPGTGHKLISFSRRQKVWMPAGTGNIADRSGNTWGGFLTIYCSLRSPRRFVINNTAALFRGESAENILTAYMRRILTDVMENIINTPAWNGTELDKQQLWTDIEKKIRQNLRSNGWEADIVRPGAIIRTGKEV